METDIDAARRAIGERLAFRFPTFPIRFESAGDEPCLLGIGVFCVPERDFATVQDFVFDLESSVGLPDGWELVPIVRNPATTRTYYPEILAAWPTTICRSGELGEAAWSCARTARLARLPEPDTRCFTGSSMTRQGKWKPEPPAAGQVGRPSEGVSDELAKAA